MLARYSPESKVLQDFLKVRYDSAAPDFLPMSFRWWTSIDCEAHMVHIGLQEPMASITLCNYLWYNSTRIVIPLKSVNKWINKRN